MPKGRAKMAMAASPSGRVAKATTVLDLAVATEAVHGCATAISAKKEIRIARMLFA